MRTIDRAWHSERQQHLDDDDWYNGILGRERLVAELATLVPPTTEPGAKRQVGRTGSPTHNHNRGNIWGFGFIRFSRSNCGAKTERIGVLQEPVSRGDGTQESSMIH